MAQNLHTQLIVIAHLKKVVTDLEKKLKAQALGTMQAGGFKSAVAKLDDEDIGTISRATPKAKLKVVDEDRATAYLAKHYPDYVRTEVVTTITEQGKRNLEEQQGADPETGELIPGLEMVQGGEYLSVRAGKEAADRIIDHLRSQSVVGFLEVEAPDGDA